MTLYDFLTVKAESREPQCWLCPRPAFTWVREVQFDFGTDKDNHDIRSVSSADLTGPVPGFCLGHLGSGPADLARAVYYQRTEMLWGLEPRRWWVVFTDGTKQGGLCEAIKLRVESHIEEDYTYGGG